MKLVLIKASSQYREQITNMLDEWYSSGEKIVPSAISRTDYHDFEMYLQSLEVKEAGNGLVPESTFFCLDEGRDKIVGAVNIRHYLNDALLLSGGHIGDGVRPSERRKGIATHMIGLALLACRRLGIFRVLMVCDKGNVGSARSILSNGGVLEDERIIDGKAVQRYWIDLTRNQADMCQGQQCKVYPHNSLGDYKYAVIFSKHKGGWLLSRHKARETWETQEGISSQMNPPWKQHGENCMKKAERAMQNCIPCAIIGQVTRLGHPTASCFWQTCVNWQNCRKVKCAKCGCLILSLPS